MSKKVEQIIINNNDEYCYRLKCKYYNICKGLIPDKWYETRGKYFCIDCDKINRNIYLNSHSHSKDSLKNN